jgi:septum site-determining protein MinC
MQTDLPKAGADASVVASISMLRQNASGIVVCELTGGIPFDQLRTSIRELFASTSDKYRGQTIRLDLGRRDFDLFDLRRLINVIKDEFGVQVVGLNCPSEALARFAERELKIRVFPSQVSFPVEPAPVAVVEPVVTVIEERQTEATELVSAPDEAEAADEGGDKTMTIHGTVRSGAVIRFAGDVQVFGDVNPGAQILAGGSVYVYGTLKGLACAGARGDNEQIILAFDMRPSQLRIGKVIQIPSQSPDRPTRYTPEIAWISGGSIIIEAYRGRHPHQRETA